MGRGLHQQAALFCSTPGRVTARTAIRVRLDGMWCLIEQVWAVVCWELFVDGDTRCPDTQHAYLVYTPPDRRVRMLPRKGGQANISGRCDGGSRSNSRVTPNAWIVPCA